jgi:hypothetical protein
MSKGEKPRRKRAQGNIDLNDVINSSAGIKSNDKVIHNTKVSALSNKEGVEAELNQEMNEWLVRFKKAELEDLEGLKAVPMTATEFLQSLKPGHKLSPTAYEDYLKEFM